MTNKTLQPIAPKHSSSLVPNKCVWFATNRVPADFKLQPEELLVTSKMANKRLNDFKSSRYCALKALSKLGIFDFPLLPNQHRAPIWPEQVVGSISHTEGRCIAVAANKHIIRSIGIDVESSQPLKQALVTQIITDSEHQQISEFDQPLLYAKLIFSIKESIFKCLHPIFNRWIGFKDVSVLLNLENKDFKVVAEQSLDSNVSLKHIKGGWKLNQQWIYTGCWLEY